MASISGELPKGVVCAVLITALGSLGLVTSVRAQHPVLAPTSNTTIVVSSAPLHYSAITVPVGVTVRFVAPGGGRSSVPDLPAVIYCDGDVDVRGTLSVSHDPFSNLWSAGWVRTGWGGTGVLCGSGFGTLFFPPGGGRHALLYGSAIPFSLQGGSAGGDLDIYDSSCFFYASTTAGLAPSGTLVVDAQGRMDIHGSVTADGIGWTSPGTDNPGSSSGGSILLRARAGLFVHPTGSVTARGGPSAPLSTFQWPLPYVRSGEPGIVRLDAWGAPPSILGTVDPPATVLELPHLIAPAPPQIGRGFRLDILAPDGSLLFLAVALQPGPGTPTPFGLLGIDPTTAATLGVAMPQPGHDPISSLSMGVPNAPALIGLGLWLQGFAAAPTLPPRLTNAVAAVVQ
jgi:hypothetical protein